MTLEAVGYAGDARMLTMDELDLVAGGVDWETVGIATAAGAGEGIIIGGIGGLVGVGAQA